MINFLIKCQDKIKEIDKRITPKMIWNATCITAITMLIAISITLFSALVPPVSGILILIVLVFILNVFSQMDLKKKD